MEKNMILVDTDVIIKMMRGDKIASDKLNKWSNNIAISSITAFELMQGIKNQRQYFSILKQLKAYSIIHVNEEISITAFNLYKKNCLKYSLHFADTLIAATAILNKIKLFTYNKKHFSFIDNIVLL
jgi:tRNA(fMet)-specific endonuclease VapC